MPTLNADEIDDLVQETLRDLGRNDIIQIAQSQQDYEVYTKWFKNDRVAFDSGYGIRRTLMNKLPGSARHTGLFQVDEIAVVNLLSQLVVPWRHATTNWAYEIREMMMNKGKSRINNIIVPRREGAIIDLIEELEEKGWASPDADNEDEPYGLPYYIVSNDTQGFNGGYPDGHTDIAGVNLTTVPTYKNWTDTYVAITKDDLIKKMRRASYKTNWKSPISVADFRSFKAQMYRIYMPYDVYEAFVDAAQAQNENLGPDVARYDGEVTFKKHTILATPSLDDTTNTWTDFPVFGVNHQTFLPVCLEEDYMRETGPQQSPKQHNTREVHYDISYNYVCLDRRRNWRFKKTGT